MDELIPQKRQYVVTTERATQRLGDVMTQAIRDGVMTCGSIVVCDRNDYVLDCQWGWQDPEAKTALEAHTLFDLASVTKLFTVTAFLRQVSAGKVTIDTPLAEIVPEFAAITPRSVIDSYDPVNRMLIPMRPEDAGKQIDPAAVTFRHLLTHTSGLPPWRKVYGLTGGPPPAPHLPDPIARETRWSRTLTAMCALDFVGVPGDRVRYSDVGLMLLGEAVARLDGRGLAEAINEFLYPNYLYRIMFRPVASGVPYAFTVPTEQDPEWRGRRVWGDVHDENASGAGGIAGHAGLFGNAFDLAHFGQLWLNGAGGLGIAPEIAKEAVREHAETDGMRRGLGFVLKAHEGANCGDLFCSDSYGHTGFTGTSLWIEPERGLVVALLTNRVYGGRDLPGPGVYELRRAVHTIVAEEIEGKRI
jgi:CubicO group peptidase (beta-lactamase class C family)